MTIAAARTQGRLMWFKPYRVYPDANFPFTAHDVSIGIARISGGDSRQYRDRAERFIRSALVRREIELIDDPAGRVLYRFVVRDVE